MGAFLGHLFPVWLGFKGGKGVATYIGVLAACSGRQPSSSAPSGSAIAVLTRYSSLSALMASLAVPVALFAAGQRPEAILALTMTALLLWKHRSNISRLMKGEEPKIGAKA